MISSCFLSLVGFSSLLIPNLNLRGTLPLALARPYYCHPTQTFSPNHPNLRKKNTDDEGKCHGGRREDTLNPGRIIKSSICFLGGCGLTFPMSASSLQHKRVVIKVRAFRPGEVKPHLVRSK